MQFNAGTCEVICYPPIPATLLHQISVGPWGVAISKINLLCELDIRMGSDATFHSQFAELVTCRRITR